jgi:chaperonin cofactor prefoldin
VSGRVAEVREEQATVGDGDVTITGDEDEPVYIIDEYDEEQEGFERANVAKPESSLTDSQRDLPSRSDDNYLAAAVRLAVGVSLDKQPIERDRLAGGEVAYRNIKLLDEGVWTDQNSRTPTLYDEKTFDNLEASYGDQYQGPPTNIAHDVHKLGEDKGEVHDASVAGYVEPRSLRNDGDSLYGDLIFDTETAAGDFADANLKSTLENNGTAGFSPSVELDPIELESTPNHPRASEHVHKARLTGVGLVRDPASESVDFAQETKERAIALSSHNDKTPAPQVTRMSKSLMDVGEVREILTNAGVDGVADMTDDEVSECATMLHDDLMEEITDQDMGMYAAYGGDDDMDMMDEDEDEEDMDMMDEDEDEDDMDMKDHAEHSDMDMAEMESQMSNVMSRLEDLEDAMADSMSASKAAAQLASAKTVKKLKKDKKDLERRLSELEDAPAEPKTLAEGDDRDYTDADTGYTYDSARGSMSR